MSNGSRQESLNTFNTASVVTSVTRPANTTAYAAGDVVAAADDSNLTFLGVVRQGNQPAFTGQVSTVLITSSANVGTKPDMELWLFSAIPATVGDNAPFTPSDAELATLVGVVDLPQASWYEANSASGDSGNSCCIVQPSLVFQGSSVDLYGVLVIRNAYVPVSGEVFTVKLVITRD